MKKQLLLLALLYIANINAYGEPKSPKEAFDCNCKIFEKYLNTHHIHQKTFNYFKEKIEKKKIKTIEKKEIIEQKQQTLQGKRDTGKLIKGSIEAVSGLAALIIGVAEIGFLVFWAPENSITAMNLSSQDSLFLNLLGQLFDYKGEPNGLAWLTSGIFTLGGFTLAYLGSKELKHGLNPALALEKDKEKIMHKLKEIKCKEKVLEESRTYYRST